MMILICIQQMVEEKDTQQTRNTIEILKMVEKILMILKKILKSL